MKPDTTFERIRRRLRQWMVVDTCLVAVVLSLTLLLPGAWLHTLLYHHGISDLGLRAQAWASLLAAALAGGGVLLLETRRAGVRRRLRDSLMLMFPGQEADIEAYFSERIVGGQESVIRQIVKGRLDRLLPQKAMIQLATPPLSVRCAAAMAAIVVAAAAITHWSGTKDACRRFVGSLLLEDPNQMIKMTSFSPTHRWLRPGRECPVAVIFDRPPDMRTLVRIRLSADKTETVPLARTPEDPARFVGRIPPRNSGFQLAIELGTRISDAVTFSVYPADVLRVEGVEVLSRPGGRVLKTVTPETFPLEVITGQALRWSIAKVPCELRSCGIGTESAPSIPLRHGPRDGLHTAEHTVERDAEFVLFWQCADGIIESGRRFDVKCLPRRPPQLVVTAPEDQSVLDDPLPMAIPVRFEAACDDFVVDGELQLTDYHGLQQRLKLDFTPAAEGRFTAVGELPLSIIEDRQGRLLGVTAAALTDAPSDNVFFAAPLNLILPFRALKNAVDDDELWKQAARNPITKLDDADNALLRQLMKARQENGKTTPGMPSPGASKRTSPEQKGGASSSKATPMPDADANDRQLRDLERLEKQAAAGQEGDSSSNDQKGVEKAKLERLDTKERDDADADSTFQNGESLNDGDGGGDNDSAEEEMPKSIAIPYSYRGIPLSSEDMAKTISLSPPNPHDLPWLHFLYGPPPGRGGGGGSSNLPNWFPSTGWG